MEMRVLLCVELYSRLESVLFNVYFLVIVIS